MRVATIKPALCLLALFVIGCQPSETPRRNLTGKVTYKGENLTIGTVEFYTTEASSPLRAIIGRDGTYRLTEALTGEYRLAIKTPRKPPAGRKAINRPNAPEPVYVPTKYAKPETSGLSVTLDNEDATHDITME